MNESQLVGAIKAHIAKGDKAKDKAEQHYIAAGQYLKQLKDDCPDQQTFLEKVEKEIGIGKSRAYELLQIGDGRKTVEEIRADTAKRVAKHEQSCPLANGQNARRPRSLSRAHEGSFAELDGVALEEPASDTMSEPNDEIIEESPAAYYARKVAEIEKLPQEAIYEQAMRLVSRMSLENLDRLPRLVRFFRWLRYEYAFVEGPPSEGYYLTLSSEDGGVRREFHRWSHLQKE